MSSIGQQLQESRSRLNYSITEASEATKIRAEYLAKLEDNSFDIPLHPVYVKGFLRLYAKFLKLNADSITQTYEDINTTRQMSHDSEQPRESLGTFTMPTDAKDGEEAEKPGQNIFERYKPLDEPKRFNLKVIGLIVAAVILIFAVVFAVRVFFLDSPPGDLANSGDNPNVSAIEDESLTIDSINENLIRIRAIAPVYIYVTQTADGEILFSGTLAANEERTLIKNGEISIICDKTENLIIEKGGLPQDLQGTTGQARLLID